MVSVSYPIAPLLALVVLISPLAAYPGGAPHSSCDNLKPDHGSRQNVNYNLALSSNNIEPGQSLTVTLSGAAWQGIIMQARRGNTPVGAWINLPSNLKTRRCSQSGDTVTQRNATNKGITSFTWVSPADSTGPVVIRATVLASFSSYTEISSSAVTIANPPGVTPGPPQPNPPAPPPGPPQPNPPAPQTPNPQAPPEDPQEPESPEDPDMSVEEDGDMSSESVESNSNSAEDSGSMSSESNETPDVAAFRNNARFNGPWIMSLLALWCSFIFAIMMN